ncbi:LTA synthase family protein [Burkholderia ubonensis]|uniref:LTA synthase family protein n=1 Tax=Burkholderia ubonensis TaxID=101571 RepID=UPI0039F4BE30
MTPSEAVTLALTVPLVSSSIMDRLVLPRQRFARGSVARMLHVLAIVFMFGGLLAASGRPWFSALMTVALNCLMIIVSNAKYATLREPFVFTDLSLFGQLFAHPRLYLPFLGGRNMLLVAGGALILAIGYALDRPLMMAMRMVGIVLVGACLAAGYGVAAKMKLSLDPIADQVRHGFFSTFVAYLVNGMRPRTQRDLRQALSAGPFAAEPIKADVAASLPDVIVIQSESYFDARQVSPAIRGAAYAQFDRGCNEAVLSGTLAVPAWGANTMRTEFAMLTGLSMSHLGYARFYPYAFIWHVCASIARWFRRAGYLTVAIHPYHADFFGRNRVFPLLGFDRFYDIGHFDRAACVGAYVADSAVADAIIDELEAARGVPRFIFAMTMENHGPLHLESVQPGESLGLHTLGERADWRDLTAYLRHVANADAMIGRLLGYLRERRRDTVVCFYGDHVPALGHVFDKLGVSPEKSNYFIWRNFDVLSGERQDLRAEELGSALLTAASVDRSNAQLECSPE